MPYMATLLCFMLYSCQVHQLRPLCLRLLAIHVQVIKAQVYGTLYIAMKQVSYDDTEKWEVLN